MIGIFFYFAKTDTILVLFTYKVFIFLLGHLHFFVHLFFTVMEKLFMNHPISFNLHDVSHLNLRCRPVDVLVNNDDEGGTDRPKPIFTIIHFPLLPISSSLCDLIG